MKKIDKKNITNIEIKGATSLKTIEKAFISYALWTKTNIPLNQKELAKLNEIYEFIYENTYRKFSTKKCKICNSKEHMVKGIDTRWNECFKCKKDLSLDEGEMNYLIEQKFNDHDFIVHTVEGDTNDVL